MLEISLLISADQEWRAWLDLHPGAVVSRTPFGECFSHELLGMPVQSFQSGWGKISAAASTQWIIDQVKPGLILNLGTCGGIEGRIRRLAVVLVEKTVVYDIREQMGDPEEARRSYESDLDLSWLGTRRMPEGVERGVMLSADRDLLSSDINWLVEEYAARVVDWESASIAWVCQKNHTPLIILRGVSDLVDQTSGETYGNLDLYETNTRKVMQNLAGQLTWWITAYQSATRTIPPA